MRAAASAAPAILLAFAVGAGLACRAAWAAPGDGLLQELRKQWRGLDRAGKVQGLTRLCVHRSPAILRQCRSWLRDEDPLVRAQVVRVVAGCATDPGLRSEGERLLGDYLDRHMDWRARREREEFLRVCREHGRDLPPDDQMAAGADWEDPYDERRRPLPEEVRIERSHMREVLAAVEEIRATSLRARLLRILEEHHDPEVLVRLVSCFAGWRDFGALLPMADLMRIQEYGREMGGRDVIGRERYDELRLRWDVHKDRLWWSRPEYVPRIKRPIAEAASAITGATIGSAAALDRWILANEATLRAKGVTVPADFRERARITGE